MECGGEENTEEGQSELVPRARQVCHFFSQGRRCNYGSKCKFLHVKDESKADGTPSQSNAAPLNSQGLDDRNRPSFSYNPKVAPAAGRRPCRYFLSGYCTMEDKCRFWHPPQLLLVDGVPVPGNCSKAAPSFPPVSRPNSLQEVKLCDVTEDIAKQMRDTEIKQLKKRFPKDQLIVQERSDGKVTYYRTAVEATDPDWVNTFLLLFVVLNKNVFFVREIGYTSHYKGILSFESFFVLI